MTVVFPHRKLLFVVLLVLVSIFAVVFSGVFASPANAWVHCYFGNNLWGGDWYCVSG